MNTVSDAYTHIELKAVKINLMVTEKDFFPGEWIRVLPRYIIFPRSGPQFRYLQSPMTVHDESFIGHFKYRNWDPHHFSGT